MARTTTYWITTGLAAVMLLFSLSYLTGNEQVVSGFAKAGYRSTCASCSASRNRRRRLSCSLRDWHS
jgi:hypothetical protein